jgi:hypothetical protein
LGSDSRDGAPTGEERDHGKYEKHQEQDLGDACSLSCDATEAEDGSDDRNNKKTYGLVQHDRVPPKGC